MSLRPSSCAGLPRTGVARVLALVTALALAARRRRNGFGTAISAGLTCRERPAASDRGLFAYATGLFIRGDYAAAADVFRRSGNEVPAIAVRHQGQVRPGEMRGRISASRRKPPSSATSFWPRSRRASGAKNSTRSCWNWPRSWSAANPRRAAELLDRLIGSRPAGKAQYEAVIEQAASPSVGAIMAPFARALEKAVALASDAEAKYEAMFKAAVNDVAESREAGAQRSPPPAGRDEVPRPAERGSQGPAREGGAGNISMSLTAC